MRAQRSNTDLLSLESIPSNSPCFCLCIIRILVSGLQL
ncbi:hypothetical protein BOS5A_211301 [Bosea sp. EC-HK365B]|nr:hypothetical protein BOSE21B_50391 [Bosea sp. 21B]VVT60510.1 hypothetical protein BOS5A_211301 [Bosea sp. EC-HK365B]